MFKKILIANRGEIACRIAATCQRMGIQTVAVYSEADVYARHVSMCDEAVLIGNATPNESYLCTDRILTAAANSGAQAIHPGYGFLSENATFAESCYQAGFTFIGPPATAIATMGSKSAAKTLMGQSGIPLVPGYHGEIQNPDFLQEQAHTIGYPILIKASAGGGGKGMRIVTHNNDFISALVACQREASHSFGNDHVLLEKYLDHPRHIEVQIFADQYNNCVYLFERDCSIQRRHQKIIEEAPAPGLNTIQRKTMGETAIAAARAVGYIGAGTVEFIADREGTFYFMEMNTRLQVEHPVTEMITGHDLVAWQIAIAAGQILPVQQEQLTIHGHAFETRIYAEDPEKKFLPSTGILLYLDTPQATEFTIDQDQVRIDSGVRQGDSISPFYDPMIAKLITWGETREQALTKMHQALCKFHIAGIKTNIDFLVRLFKNAEFSQAQLDTGLIERHQDALLNTASLSKEYNFLFIAGATVAKLQQERNAMTHLHSPWAQTNGWRISGCYQRTLQFLYGEETWTASLSYQSGKLILQAFEQSAELYFSVQENYSYRLILNNQQYSLNIFPHNNHFYLYGSTTRLELVYLDPLITHQQEEYDNNQLTAPMPGKILVVHVQSGQNITKNTPLLIMEAMKMEHTIVAPKDGKVEAIYFSVGEQVAEGQQLLSLTIDENHNL